MMKRLLPAAVLGLGIAACTVTEVPAGSSDGGTPKADAGPGSADDASADAAPLGPGTADDCLDGQDMNADDVDVSRCPPIPNSPGTMKVNGKTVELGAWELGTTASGQTYQYGSLTGPETNPRILKFSEIKGEDPVNDGNLQCWAKNYYRLRKILQTPPAEWLALRDAGFQYRFFQFQTDLRNGATGYKSIASFQDHLIKWVSVVDKTGACQQTTLGKFKSYATSELKRRNLPVPPSN